MSIYLPLTVSPRYYVCTKVETNVVDAVKKAKGLEMKGARGKICHT